MVKEIVKAVSNAAKANSASGIIKAGATAAKTMGKWKASSLAKTALAGKTARTVARAAAIGKVAEAREAAAKYNYNATLNALDKYNSLINMNPTKAEGTGDPSKTESNPTEVFPIGN